MSVFLSIFHSQHVRITHAFGQLYNFYLLQKKGISGLNIYLPVCEFLGKTEIRYLQVTIPVQQKIFWFQISVYNGL